MKPRAQSREFEIAERVANLFGKYFRTPGDTDFGGIEDKVLADLCHHAAKLIEEYGLDKFGDGIDSEIGRMQNRLDEHDDDIYE